MRVVIVSGPPSSGKTSVVSNMIESMMKMGYKAGVMKFDCLYADDDVIYKNKNITAKKGLSGALCPDHFFVSNIEDSFAWAKEEKLDIFVAETAGLCNRCAPYIKGVTGICVIDNLSGINTPKKIGPMLKSADIVAITKSDIVSQAEKEVFASRVSFVNPRALTIHINGLTGQGSEELAKIVMNEDNNVDTLKGLKLRFPMPAALCSYCLGETRIGEEYQLGNIKKIQIS